MQQPSVVSLCSTTNFTVSRVRVNLREVDNSIRVTDTTEDGLVEVTPSLLNNLHTDHSRTVKGFRSTIRATRSAGGEINRIKGPTRPAATIAARGWPVMESHLRPEAGSALVTATVPCHGGPPAP